jgi:hypothetical protein
MIKAYVPRPRDSVGEVKDDAERARLRRLAVAAFSPYADYQK